MGWDKSKPEGTTKVKDSPVYFQTNWDALENTLGREHYTLDESLSGYHKSGKCGVVYIGTHAALTAAWAAPPTGSIGIATDAISGAKAIYVCTASAGSGTWTNYSPSHLFLSDLTCGDPHTQYPLVTGDTLSGAFLVLGAVSISGNIVCSGSVGISGHCNIAGSLFASGSPQSTNEVVTKAHYDNTARWRVVQIVKTSNGNCVTGTNVVPWDDTKPQLSECTVPFLDLSITPSRADCWLIAEATLHFSNNNYGVGSMACLFTNIVGEDAVDVGAAQYNYGATYRTPYTIYLTWGGTPGTTSTRTFSVRGGVNQSGGGAYRYAFNGDANTGVRMFGGAMVSSLTVTEYASA